MRQKQKNNFSLRLACVGGTLTAENLKKIAEVAEKYGDGYVHLTSRQGVEIPFIKLDDIDDVKDERYSKQMVNYEVTESAYANVSGKGTNFLIQT